MTKLEWFCVDGAAASEPIFCFVIPFTTSRTLLSAKKLRVNFFADFFSTKDFTLDNKLVYSTKPSRYLFNLFLRETLWRHWGKMLQKSLT